MNVGVHDVEKITISKKQERRTDEIFYTRDIIIHGEDDEVHITLFSDHKENLSLVNVK